MDEARLRLGSRLCIRRRYIGGNAQEHAAALRFGGRSQRLAIGLYLRRDLRRGLVADSDEDRQSLPAVGYKRIGTRGGNADRWRRLLIRLGHHRDVLEPVILA